MADAIIMTNTRDIDQNIKSNSAFSILEKHKLEIKDLFEYIEFGLQNEIDTFMNKFNKDEKVSILTVMHNNMNCFHACCKYGRFSLLEYFLNFEYVNCKKSYFIDLPNRDGDTCLLIATGRNYNDIAAYLVFLGADINRKNNYGRTPLHFASLSDSLDIFELLINSGALLNAKDALFMTPLFLAANHAKFETVQYIIDRGLCCREEAIHALEVVGCSFVKYLKFDKAFFFWKRALLERMKEPEIHKEPIENELLGREHTNEEELDQISNNHEQMVLQSILVLERLYGIHNLIVLHRLSESSCYFEYNENYNLAILLVVKMINNQSDSKLIAFLSTYESFHRLLMLLIKIHKKDQTNYYHSTFLMVFELFTKQLKQNSFYLKAKTYLNTKNHKEYDDSLLLYGCYIIFFASEIQSKNHSIDQNIIHKIKQLIYEIIKLDFKCYITGYSLLHLTLAIRIDDLFNIKKKINTIQLMIECGATSLVYDKYGNTPLHICMSMEHETIEEKITIAKLLLDSGAHIDAKNTSGKLAYDIDEHINENNQAFVLSIKPLKFLTLKCFCSQIIRKYHIPYKGLLPKTLEEFVSIH